MCCAALVVEPSLTPPLPFSSSLLPCHPTSYTAQLVRTDEDVFSGDSESDDDSDDGMPPRATLAAAGGSFELKSIRPCTGPFKPEPLVEETDPWDLHEHLVLLLDRLALIRVKEMKLQDGSKLIKYRATTGALWSGANETVDIAKEKTSRQASQARPIFLDLGYIGDFLREHAACSELMSTTASSLLTAVADPRQRLTLDLYPGQSLLVPHDCPLPINNGQLSALRGLQHEVEAIQGPPGTGKSTAIYHIVEHIMSAHTDAVTLASCVQVRYVAIGLHCIHNALYLPPRKTPRFHHFHALPPPLILPLATTRRHL
jgi:hypothetical protein